MTRILASLVLLIVFSISTSADISEVPTVDNVWVEPGLPFVLHWHQTTEYDVNHGTYWIWAGSTGGAVCQWVGWGYCDCEYTDNRALGGTDFWCSFDSALLFRSWSYPGKCFFDLTWQDMTGRSHSVGERVYWDCYFVFAPNIRNMRLEGWNEVGTRLEQENIQKTARNTLKTE